MVIQSVHGDVVVEAGEAAMANPGELQVGVEDNQLEVVDPRKMTRSTSSYHSQDIRLVCIIPSRIQRKPSYVLSH